MLVSNLSSSTESSHLFVPFRFAAAGQWAILAGVLAQSWIAIIEQFKQVDKQVYLLIMWNKFDVIKSTKSILMELILKYKHRYSPH